MFFSSSTAPPPSSPPPPSRRTRSRTDTVSRVHYNEPDTRRCVGCTREFDAAIAVTAAAEGNVIFSPVYDDKNPFITTISEPSLSNPGASPVLRRRGGKKIFLKKTSGRILCTTLHLFPAAPTIITTHFVVGVKRLYITHKSQAPLGVGGGGMHIVSGFRQTKKITPTLTPYYYIRVYIYIIYEGRVKSDVINVFLSRSTISRVPILPSRHKSLCAWSASTFISRVCI